MRSFLKSRCYTTVDSLAQAYLPAHLKHIKEFEQDQPKLDRDLAQCSSTYLPGKFKVVSSILSTETKQKLQRKFQCFLYLRDLTFHQEALLRVYTEPDIVSQTESTDISKQVMLLAHKNLFYLSADKINDD